MVIVISKPASIPSFLHKQRRSSLCAEEIGDQDPYVLQGKEETRSILQK